MGNTPDRTKEFTPHEKFIENFKKAPKDKQKVVLLATGGFNPCHHMHVRMFQLAKKHLEKEKGFVVVGGYISPSHDEYLYGKLRNTKSFQDATVRGNLLKLEIEESGDSDWLWVDYWESKSCEKFVGHSDVLYTLHDFLVDILKENNLVEEKVDEKQSEKEEDRIYPIRTMYLGGRDLWLRCNGHDFLQTPKHGFVMMEREDTSVTSSDYHAKMYQTLMEKRGPHLFVVNNPDENKMGFTSTELRKLIREKRFDEIKEDLLCRSAVKYIQDNHLTWEEATLKTC